MDNNKLQELEDHIRNASPLDLAVKLQEAELYDKKGTREIVEEVYNDFNSSKNLKKEVVIPVFLKIADGLLESTAATRNLRKKGLTASRLLMECQCFTYENPGEISGVPDAYSEWKNAREQTQEQMQQFGKTHRPAYNSYDAHVKSATSLKAYKTKRMEENGGRVNLINEYTGVREVYPDKNNMDGRRSDPKYYYRGEVDHIVPLAEVHNKLKGDYTLSDDDIISVANVEENYALTTMKINRGKDYGKFDMSVDEFIALQEKNKAEGKPFIDLTEEQKENMRSLEANSIEEMKKEKDKRRMDNILGRGDKEQQKTIVKESAKGAAKQSTDYMIGNVILYFIKPLYYEISDIVTNGLQGGVGANSVREAFSIRFGRVKDYVMVNAISFIGDNIWEFVKGFISSFIEGLISLFVGIFKQIFKLVKEGIKIFIQAGKVIFGKDAKQMSAEEKGDAILKLIGGSVIAICGIGIEALLNKMGIGDPFATVLSTMLSGIASVLFMFLLDRIDLFSVKSQKRSKRIEEIFDERIKDIKEATESFNTAALETMRAHRLKMAEITEKIWKGINGDDIDTINSGLFELAESMKVDLPYKNREEFLDFIDNNHNTIEL